MVWSGNKAPPQETEATISLAQWVEDELERFSNEEIDNRLSLDMRENYNSPLRPRTGLQVYADGTKWNPGLGEGMYFYRGGLWTPMWGGRLTLPSNTTFYVRTDGLDTNTGRTNDAAGAFLTLQGAYNAVCSKYDFGGNTVTISVQAGTYNAGISASLSPVGGPLIIQGDTATPSNCVVSTTNNYCFVFFAPLLNRVTVQGFRLQNTGTGADLVRLQAPGLLTIQAIEFFTNTQFYVATIGDGAQIGGGALGVSCLVSPAGGVGFYAQTKSQHLLRGMPYYFEKSINFAVAFAYASGLADENYNACTFLGLTTVTISIAVPGVVTLIGHAYADNVPVRFNTSGALPTGITAGTEYYVVAAGKTANTFSVSATPGGAAITTSGTQSGTHKVFSATGPRYYAEGNSLIYTNGSGTGFLPGSVAGSLPTGGQYI